MKKSVLFLILFGIFLISLNFVSAWSDNGSLVQNVDGCGTFSTENAVYNLNQSISSIGTCLNVTANNTIIDCQNNLVNYSIGGGANTYGIYTNKFNTTIKNCNITDGNWTSGIASRYGIYVSTNNNSTLFNNSLDVNSSSAIYLYRANFSNLTSNTAISNTTHAIYVYESNFNNLISNVGTSNLRHGISLNSASNNNLISNTGLGLGCSTCNTDGIFLYLSHNNNLISNIGRSTEEGILLYSSSNNTLTNNTGISNVSVGLYLYKSSSNTLTNNTGTSDEGYYGILLDLSSNNNNLTSSTGISNSSRGIAFDRSSNNTLTKATALNLNPSAGSAIYIREANYTTISDCVNISGISGDVYIHSDAGSVENIFINCSYNLSKESVNGAGNYLIRKWYLDVVVNLENANVIGVNVSGVELFSELTDVDGSIERQELIEYTNLNGVRTYATPHTISTTKTGYVTSSTNYNLTLAQNVNHLVTLVAEATPPTESPITPSGSLATYHPTQEQLQEGYSRLLRKTQKVQVNLSNGKEYLIEVKEVNKTQEKVVVNVDGSNYSIVENSSGKFDLNSDGYYDLQVSVKEIRVNGFAELEFKEIHEEVPAEEQEEQQEPSKTEEIKWWWVVGGLSIIIISVIVWKRKIIKKFFKSKYL